jgi:protein-tyrosine phosphatase
VIDLHCHLLPGIDDGPRSVEESVALARAHVAAGVTTVAATPHVVWDLPANDAALIARVTADLRERLRAEDVALEVATGAEVAVTRAAELDDDELTGLRLGGGPWLLLECPLSPAAVGFDHLARRIADRGHRVVLAHPERAPVVHRDPDVLRALLGEGMLCQVTAGSLRGDFGRTVREFTLDLFAEGLVHTLASDAHDAVRRPPGLRDALAGLEAELPGLGEQERWLTHDVPAAILLGGEVPERPVPPPQRRRRGGLGGRLRRGARSR